MQNEQQKESSKSVEVKTAAYRSATWAELG